MSIIATLQQRMLEISNNENLPVNFKSDLEIDGKELARFQSHASKKLVWLLRPSGTVLVPVALGVDPGFITHWIWSETGPKIKAYVVDVSTGTIERITHEEAERLIMMPPCELTSLMDKNEVVDKVSAVLCEGAQSKIWGVFNPVSRDEYAKWNWDDWLSFFRSSGNSLMQSFMGKAIHLLNG